MPSRPVLIGRGLVPTPYKTTYRLHASTMQFPDHNPPGLVGSTDNYTQVWPPTPVGVSRKSYGGHSETGNTRSHTEPGS